MWKEFIEYLKTGISPEDDEFELEEEPVLPFGKDKDLEERTPKGEMIYINKLRGTEEVKDIIDILLKGDLVIVNLEKLGDSCKQRVIDMLTGYCYSNDQRLRQVNKMIYIVSK